MRISQHLARVDLDALKKLPDSKNKEWLLSFYEEHKNGRFNASLKQIQLIETEKNKINDLLEEICACSGWAIKNIDYDIQLK